MLYATALLALGALARAGEVLFEGNNYRGTVYYDIAGVNTCYVEDGGQFASNWATDINSGVPMCNGNTDATSLNGFHTDRIVAMNVDMVRGDKTKWCGKEVQIFKDGKQIILDEGPFILWDGCAACASANIIDLSAKAFVMANGGTCLNNPEGLTVKVLDNDISHTLTGGSPNQGSESDLVPPSSSTSASSTSESPAETPAGPAPSTPTDSGSDNGDAKDKSKDVTQGAQQLAAEPEVDHQDSNTGGEKKLNVGNNYVAESPSKEAPAAATPTPAAAETPASSSSDSEAPAPTTSDDKSTLPAPASDAKADSKSASDSGSSSSSSGSACTFGKWQCDGLKLQVCNMAGQTETKWETIASCSSQCSFTTTGSAICE